MRCGTAYLALLLIIAFSPPAAASGPALVFEATSGKVLYAEGADNQWYPASLTKMMTAYLAFEAIKSGRLSLKSKISCSATAHAEPPSKIGLPIGGELTVDKALQALIVKSANDVAVMLAEAIGGNEQQFVNLMNVTAKRLGMTRTHFVNANGLPAAEQMTTARDLAKLARVIITEYPEYDHYWSMPHMRLGKNRLRSHNGLLRSLEGADGFKTGFTCDSGFNIIASATRDGNRLVAVVLGDPSSAERNVRAASLIEYGFQKYGWAQIFNYKTVDSMPLKPTATGVTSVRQTVDSWGCNPKKKKKKARVTSHGKRDKRAAKKKPTSDKPAVASSAQEVGGDIGVGIDLSAPELRSPLGLAQP
ncbi:MAG TPA: D-alanyl-D-alanine carboxypeptidase family protein [Hyphomicrobium sp.]